MTADKHDRKTGFSLRLSSILVPLAGSLLILLAMNIYQYVRVKDDLASTVINEMGDSELGELKSFFDNLTSKLNMVHDWGVNGVLDTDDLVGLNRKFMPLINRQAPVSGLLLANDRGGEYFLYRDKKGWVTRVSAQENGITRMVFRRWVKPDQAGEEWRKTSSYDPRKRPWFHTPSDSGAVRWTPVYSFFETGRKGVTASVAWMRPDGNGFMVFAMDIPLSNMRTILARLAEKRPGILFLVNSSGTILISSDDRDTTGATDELRPVAHPSDAPAAAVTRQWLAEDRLVRKSLTVEADGQRWIASLRPLDQSRSMFWVGSAVPEKELLDRLNETLFRVDSVDVLVALAGGLLLFVLVWRTGGLHHGAAAPPPSPLQRLRRCIEQGEGAEVEFKSTVRTNLKSGKPGKEIELAWLKAVVAFLNSNGGSLLLGVDDDGVLVGLAADNFDNPDRCLLHIKNLLNQHIGAEFARCLEVTLVEDGDNQAVLIECRPATEPVFLKIGKNEEFYIRSGPSSIKLSPSRMVSYILQNRNPAAARRAA